VWEEKRYCGKNFKLVSRKYDKGLGGFRADACFGGRMPTKGRIFTPREREVKRARLMQQTRKDK